MKLLLLAMERSLTLMEVTALTIEAAKEPSTSAEGVLAETTPGYTVRFQAPYIASVN
jgi:hypothetical protein